MNKKEIKISKEIRTNKKSAIKNYANQAGINLVALVVTIVVLLILAGVSINVLFGNNGIIKRAQDSQNKMDQAALNDLNSLDDVNDTIDYSVEGKINWDRILNNANKLAEEDRLDELKPADQVVSSLVGIGTDGKPVNMDLWNAVLIEGGWRLSNPDAGFQIGKEDIGYRGDIENGKIIGKLPQYIYSIDDDEFLPVINMTNAFNSVSDLKIAPIIPSSVTNMSDTFYNCISLTTAPTIPSSVINMAHTFDTCTSLRTAPTIPSSVINMAHTFDTCTSLTTVPTIPSSVINMSYTFYNCTSLATAPTIPSSVTNMSSTFDTCTSLTTAPTIPSSVTNMSHTFYNCTSLTTAPTIPSSVTSMDYTFRGCSKLQGTIEINANPTYYSYCFLNAATEGSGLVVTGTSTILDEIIATKGTDNTKITKGN